MNLTFKSILIFLLINSFIFKTLTSTFDLVDQDKDGVISKKEFESYVSSLKGAVNPYIDVSNELQDNNGDTKLPVGLVGGKVNKDDPIDIDEDLQFWHASIKTFMMIIVTELGDKTFFLAALLAMQYPKGVVFGGAMCKLFYFIFIF